MSDQVGNMFICLGKKNLPTKDKGNTRRLVNNENEEVVDDEGLPDNINMFFIGICPKLGGRFHEEWEDNIPNYSKRKQLGMLG